LAIASYYTQILVQFDKFSLFFLSPHSYAKLSISKKHLILIWMVLFSSMTMAINTDQWLIQKIQVEDGLPNATIFSVQQDRAGFLWFGTVNGVARYDGYDFKVYHHDEADLNTISNDNAGNLFIDSKNILWIGTFGGGFNTLDLQTGQLTRHPYSNDSNEIVVSESVQTFHEDKQSNMWIGTPNGLYKYSDKIVKHYKHDEADSGTLIHSRVWDITEDQAGNIWIGTSQGLSKLNPKTEEINNYELPKNLVEDISSSEFRTLYLYNDELWIGSSSALYVFDLTTLQFNAYPLKYNIKINELMLMGNMFLVATMGGLYQFDIVNKVFLADEKKQLWRLLKYNDIRKTLVDQSGLLWLASRDSGVFKIDQTGGLFKKQKKIYADDETNELSQKTWAFEFDDDGNSFFGTSDTLFKKTSENKIIRIVTKNNDQIPGKIRVLRQGKNQGMWIGSSDGLYYLRKGETIADEIREPFDIIGIKPADIFSIEETLSGEVWLSFSNLGVLRWNRAEKKAQLLQKFNGMLLTDLGIGKIVQDSQQNIWMTTNLVGLIKFDIKKDEMTLFSHDYSDENSISSNRVRDILEDDQGRLWIGTSRGVNLYNKNSNTFQSLGSDEGLLDESILAILEDSKSNIWVSHNFGISRINKEFDKAQKFRINSTIRKDGLNIRSANINKEGQLYFGGMNGIYTFDPNDLQTCIQYQPSLLLTRVSINNLSLTSVELATKGNYFDLFHQDRVIFLEFSALEYNSPDHVQYSYRVAGINKNWHDVTTSRNIELNSLKPGKYLLEIKANNSDCRWSEQNIKITIDVHPVWWNLWWVRLVFIISGIFVAFLYHYLRSSIIRKRNLDLEKLVENRTSELTLLNKKLKSASQTDFLTGLYNRKGFFNKFNNKSTTSSRSCIVLADIDHFKSINDLYGHLAGDKVLIDITKIMRSFIQKQDFVARWGGEEFIFYFDNESPTEIYNIIERIRIEIEKTKIVYARDEMLVTCTFGICQIQTGMELNDCIKAADESMYIGKSKGRNTTVVSDFSE